MANSAEVPEISSAYSIAPLVNLSFLESTPSTVKFATAFTTRFNLRLKNDYFEDAQILKDLFIDWGLKCPRQVITYFDFGIANLNNGNSVLTKTSKEFNLGELAKEGLFSEAGYNFNIIESAPVSAGSYILIARLRRNEEPDNFSIQSAGVVTRPLEVMFNPELATRKRI
jgi:hypothetical protein